MQDNVIDEIDEIEEDAARAAENAMNMVPYEDVDTVKPWRFKKGNDSAKKDVKKRLKDLSGWSITKELRKRYRKRENIAKFVNRLEEIFFEADISKSLAAGVQILERVDGKVKEMVEIGKTRYIPDQQQTIEMVEMFRIKEGKKVIEGVKMQKIS